MRVWFEAGKLEGDGDAVAIDGKIHGEFPFVCRLRGWFEAEKLDGDGDAVATDGKIHGEPPFGKLVWGCVWRERSVVVVRDGRDDCGADGDDHRPGNEDRHDASPLG